MSILIDLLFGGLGIFRKWPVITGLLLFSVVGMGWSYYEGRAGANERFQAARNEAILKDTKQNQAIMNEALKDLSEHQTTLEKSQDRLEKDIDQITNIKSSKCLDTKLSDIGLH